MHRRLVRHRAFYVAAGAGIVCFGLAVVALPAYGSEIGANVMFACYLALVFSQMRRLTPEFLKHRADQEDPPVGLIFGVTSLVVLVAIGSLFEALNQGGPPQFIHIAMGLVSVVLGWFTINTMAAMHYAYEYYEAPESGDGIQAARGGKGGLNFPDGDMPDGVSFLYFAYTIGMTAQVSDIAASSNAMRKLITIHAVFSFFFNTVILAAAVNLVITLAGGHAGAG